MVRHQGMLGGVLLGLLVLAVSGRADEAAAVKAVEKLDGRVEVDSKRPDKPVVAVFYGMELGDLEESGQGKGMLEDINVLQLNDIERYLTQLASRVNGANHV